MRILVVTINYWPEQTGIGALMTRRCEHLASLGHKITVCTGMPYYPEWKIYPGYTEKLFSREERNGVTILRSRMWVPEKVTSVKRILFEASFLAASFLRALFSDKPDLLLVVSPPLGLGISAVLLSRWWHIPYVFDVQDLQPDAAAELGMLPRFVLPLLYKIEATAYKSAALISTLTEGMRQRIISKGIPEEKVALLPLPADGRLFYVGNMINGQDFRCKHGLEEKFLVVHSGNMGVKQGLDVVLNAALQLKERRQIVFLLVGAGAMKAHLEQRAAELQLDNIRFLPLQDDFEFLQMLAATDVALIVQQPTASDIAFPSKTVTLLSAARPVIASVSANSEVAHIVYTSQGGRVVEPGNARLLAQAIQQLSDAPGNGLVMGKYGREYALNSWDAARVFHHLESELIKATGTEPLGPRSQAAALGSS